MELLNKHEINYISEKCGYSKAIDWSIRNFSEYLIGYLGEHLTLTINVEANGVLKELKLFIKCIPIFDKLKAKYIRDLNFFKKEFVVLSGLFKYFSGSEGPNKWRPKLLFIKEDLFVFEDVTELGYRMPNHRETMNYNEIIATVEVVAKFHAQSYIYEEKKSKQLGRLYRIWEDFSDYLQEPDKSYNWRNAGKNAVISFLEVYSKHNSKPNFSKKVEEIVTYLFTKALALMKPSAKYRNVVIHRDLWSNNIFLKKQNEKFEALIVDFQTVLYASPMLDLSSILYFNTSRQFRDDHLAAIVDFYYEVLTQVLHAEHIDISTILNKDLMLQAYEESIIFGITQAALIVPITVMSSENREKLFSNPETGRKMDEISRSDEFIDIANADDKYRNRVIELFDEIVVRYVYP